MRTSWWLIPLLLAGPLLADTRVVVQNNTRQAWITRLEQGWAQPAWRVIEPAARRRAFRMRATGRTELVRASLAAAGSDRELGLRFEVRGDSVRFALEGGPWARLGKDETLSTELDGTLVSLSARRDEIEVALWEAPPRPSPTGPDELSVLAWNVWLRPTTLFGNGQRRRVERMPELVAGHDVLVLSEAFDDDEREVLLERLRPEYPHASRIVGEDKFLCQDGGVIVVSRWPIVAEAQEVYTDYSGSDGWSDKGVLWVRILKHGRPWNLVATHMQAGPQSNAGKVAIREKQLSQIQRFLGARGIPRDEPVLFAGDLNVDLRGREMARAKELLGAEGLRLEGPLRFTYDPALDPLALEDEPREHLDHVLASTVHAPLEGSATVVALRPRQPLRISGERVWDLSDHFAVSARVKLAPPRVGLVAGLEGR